MFKLIVLLKKKPDMINAEFTKYWLDTHAPMAKKMPGLRRYVVNVVRPPPSRVPDFDGVVEMWFDESESMKKAFASPEGQEIQKDTERFTSKVTTLFIDEHVIT